MSGFSFDAKAALKQARRAREVPTFPTLPTDASSNGEKVGSVGTVGSDYAGDAGITQKEIARDNLEEGGASTVSKVLQSAMTENTTPGVANVESVATPGPPLNDSLFQKTVGGRLATWTGCVVSLDEWRSLTAWKRHGPDGRYWCGISREWRTPK